LYRQIFNHHSRLILLTCFMIIFINSIMINFRKSDQINQPLPISLFNETTKAYPYPIFHCNIDI
jgi:hypothetical protein